MRNSFGVWSKFQVKHAAKSRSKSGGAKRKDWARNSKNAYKAVCFVRTRNDDNQ
jgi:hypothetical protein